MPFEEPLVQVYQTMPFDMMPMAMGKDAKPAEEQKKIMGFSFFRGAMNIPS
jgi:hypothetical protein